MKVRLIELEPGDVIYYLGSEYLVKTVSVIYQSISCINLKTGYISFITSTYVTLICREQSLF